MSVAEITEELKRMTREERAEIVRILVELEEPPTEEKAKTFAEAKAYVFDNYGELLKRLAE